MVKYFFGLFLIISINCFCQDASSLFEEGSKKFIEGNYKESKEIFSEAILVAEKEFGSNSETYAVYLSYYANALFRCNEYKLAEDFYLKSAEISYKYINDSPETFIYTISNLASVYVEIGRYSEAEINFKKALSLLDENHNAYRQIKNSLIVLYQKMNKQSVADSLLSSLENVTGLRGFELANHYNIKAINEYNKGNLLLSTQYLKEALIVFEKEVGTSHPFYSDLLNNIATIFQENGQYKKAEEYYLKAVELKKNENNYSLSFFIALTNLAKFYCDIENNTEAEKTFDEVNNSLNYMIQKFFPWLTEKEKSDFWSLIKVNTDWYFSFGLNIMNTKPRIKGKMLDYQLFTKAILLNSAKHIRDGILQSKNEFLLKSYNKWIFEKRMMDNADENNKDSIKNIVKNLERKISEIGKQFLDTSKTSWEKIKESISEDEAAIEIARINYSDAVNDRIVQYIAFIVKKDLIEPEIILYRNGIELETRYYKNYINHLKQNKIDKDTYLNYLKPISESLKGIKRVYLSSDGIFNQINLATILIDTSSVSKKYLIDSIEVISISNIKQIIETKSQFQDKRIRGKAVLIGNPDFEQSKTYIKSQNEAKTKNIEEMEIRYFENLASLEGSQKEIEGIDSLLTENKVDCEVFVKTSAEEKELYKLLNPAILHIATHGFFLNDVVYKRECFLGIKKDDLSENPLLRSGLFFAGIKSKSKQTLRDNDGLFTANDALSLSLEKTDLVVLSACETGLGEVVAGEGVYGLLRSFQVAGAKNILASLWKIDDFVAYKMMISFYRNLTKENDIKSSYRNAVLEIKENYPQPYFWGAFILLTE